MDFMNSFFFQTTSPPGFYVMDEDPLSGNTMPTLRSMKDMYAVFKGYMVQQDIIDERYDSPKKPLPLFQFWLSNPNRLQVHRVEYLPNMPPGYLEPQPALKVGLESVLVVTLEPQ